MNVFTISYDSLQMRDIVTRDRTKKDDINAIRKICKVVDNEKEIIVPKPSSEPIVVWKDSITDNELATDDEIILKCLEWPISTKSRCHHCAYSFEGVPIPLPMHKDEVRNVYYCQGRFCSWQCAKGFNVRETDYSGRGNRNMYIAILAFRMWSKLKNEIPFDADKARTYCYRKIDIAPPRSTLIDFGGKKTIKEYRRGFCGIIPPSDLIAITSPFLTIKSMAIMPFIDTDNVANSSNVKAIDSTPSFMGTKQMDTNHVQVFNNSFCDRLKKAKTDPTLMKRKKKRDDSNTLLSSMGIQIKKRAL